MAKLPHISLARFVLATNSNCGPSGGYFVRDLRVLVRERLAAGDTDVAVLAFVEARYSELCSCVHACPRARCCWGRPPTCSPGAQPPASDCERARDPAALTAAATRRCRSTGSGRRDTCEMCRARASRAGSFSISPDSTAWRAGVNASAGPGERERRERRSRKAAQTRT
jgi:hypothetical protein